MSRLSVYGFMIVGLGLISACSDGQNEQQETIEPVRPAKIAQALAADMDPVRTFPGTVEASRKSDLSFRVGGEVEQLAALPGQSFKKGDLLAALDDAQYRNNFLDLQARHSLAKSQYEKIIQLRKNNHVSPTEVDQASANLKSAEAALALAKDNLEHTRLLAPFDGVVASLGIEQHQVVNAHETILQLRSEHQLDVRFSIPETLIGKLRRVENPESICVDVRFNTFPDKTFPACFKEFESSPDRITRTYSAVHTLPEIKEFTALPGMAVSVEVDLANLLRERTVGGVLVPTTAVFEESGTSYVWLVNDEGIVNKQAVVLGNVQGDLLHLESGVTPGQSIVSVGVSFLQEGMRVRPMLRERGL